MIFQEEFIVNYPVQEAWEFFTDFPSPILALPGVQQVHQVGPHRYLGVIKALIGPFSFLFKGDMHILKVDHHTREVIIKGGAHDSTLGGNFTGTARARTMSAGPHRSKVVMEVHIGLGGVLGKFGVWLLQPKARSVVESYAQLVSRAMAQRRLEREALAATGS